jgi:hypothetical protein
MRHAAGSGCTGGGGGGGGETTPPAPPPSNPPRRPARHACTPPHENDSRQHVGVSARPRATHLNPGVPVGPLDDFVRNHLPSVAVARERAVCGRVVRVCAWHACACHARMIGGARVSQPASQPASVRLCRRCCCRRQTLLPPQAAAPTPANTNPAKDTHTHTRMHAHAHVHTHTRTYTHTHTRERAPSSPFASARP